MINSEDSLKRRLSLDILAEYQQLLEDYDLILSISNKVLNQVSKKLDDDKLLPLLEKKLVIADRISKSSKKISRIDLATANSPTQLQIVKQAKSIIAQIKNKAELLLKCENQIESILKDKGLKIK